jgi:hypothetical protein
MRARILAIVAVVACGAAVFAAGTAQAGGTPSRLVVIGSGRSSTIRLTVGQGTALYGGRSASPSGGYLRLFPLFSDTPGLPARFYPIAGVVCFDAPHPGCRRAAPTIAARLHNAAGLPLLHQPPTTVVSLRMGGRPVIDNLRFAVELALDRTGRVAEPPRRAVVALTAIWRGPSAASRPRRLDLTQAGVYAGGQLYRLPRAVWDSWGEPLLPAAASSPAEAPRRVGASEGARRWTPAALGAAALVAALVAAGTVAALRRRANT